MPITGGTAPSMSNTQQEMFSGTGEIPTHLKFDEARLADYLATHLQGYSAPLHVEKFRGGQSNPTYLLTCGEGTSEQQYVLRRKPPGKLLPSAHAIEREYRVLTALGKQGLPVPRTYMLCENSEIIGTPFFLMDFVRGRIFWDATLPECSKEERREIYNAMAETLAKLHSVDYNATGLSDYGKVGDYFARQITRWSRQYKDSETDPIEAMDLLIEWLPTHIPTDDQTTIVHGDFRLDNLIFHPDRPEIIAILDWELSTLGHPLADLTYFLMTWQFPPHVRGGLSGLDLPTLNIPTLEDMAQRYAKQSGIGDGTLPDLDYCLAYNMFRLAAIAQGVYRRGLQGNASSKESVKIAAQIPALAALGWHYAQKSNGRR